MNNRTSQWFTFDWGFTMGSNHTPSLVAEVIEGDITIKGAALIMAAWVKLWDRACMMIERGFWQLWHIAFSKCTPRFSFSSETTISQAYDHSVSRLLTHLFDLSRNSIFGLLLRVALCTLSSQSYNPLVLPNNAAELPFIIPALHQCRCQIIR